MDMPSLRKWMSENKLSTVGALWGSALATSLAYNCTRPSMKPSLRLIHARIHAQAVTLAALSGAALLHLYEQNAKK